MKVQVFNHREEMGTAAGKAVEARILQLAETQDEIRMVFGAAPSQDEMLRYLRESEAIPWPRIVAFHMDEYIGLPAGAPQSFAQYLKEHLFDAVPLKQALLLDGTAEPEAECARYAESFNAAPIDIVCLGIGENGHIAFNDPPVADFNDPKTVKVVELDQACRQQQVNDGCFARLDDVPERALTLTVPAMMSGAFLSCVVPGERKRAAVQAALNDEIGPQCPATVLRRHPDCSLFLDRDSYGSAG